MPRLMGSQNDDSMQTSQIGGQGFTFSGTRVEHLTSTEYTLATIAVDETGSVMGFHTQLRDMLIAAVNACKKSPRSDNILVRALLFGTQYPNGCEEIHGFKPLNDIDTNNYPAIQPRGSTPLNDTVYSAVGATNAYGKQLRDQDYNVNGIVFVITDGGENASSTTTRMVKDELADTVRSEQLESMISILIGVNAGRASQILAHYQQETGMTHYIDAGDATPQKLAKMAEFVSQSVSSQSQALGTGGPSQNIAAVI
jgi:uncharacterized protein YegL